MRDYVKSKLATLTGRCFGYTVTSLVPSVPGGTTTMNCVCVYLRQGGGGWGWGLGLRPWGSGLGCKVEGLGFLGWGFGCRV